MCEIYACTKEKVSCRPDKKLPGTARRRRIILRIFACKHELKQFGDEGKFQRQFEIDCKTTFEFINLNM